MRIPAFHRSLTTDSALSKWLQRVSDVLARSEHFVLGVWVSDGATANPLNYQHTNHTTQLKMPSNGRITAIRAGAVTSPLPDTCTYTVTINSVATPLTVALTTTTNDTYTASEATTETVVAYKAGDTIGVTQVQGGAWNVAELVTVTLFHCPGA